MSLEEVLLYLFLTIIFIVLGKIIFSSSKKGIQYAVLFVIISTTIHRERFNLPIELDAISVSFLLGTLLLTRIKITERTKFFPLAIPIAGYILTNFVTSLINSPVPENSIRQSIILTIRAITFFIVTISIQFEPTLRFRAPIYYIALLAIHTFTSIIALVIYPILQTPLVQINQDGRGSLSINGFFLEPNLYGIFCLCVASMLMAMMLFTVPRQRSWLFGGLFIAIIGMALSYTRSAWLGLILCLVVLTLVLVRQQRAQLFSILTTTTLPIVLIIMLMIAGLFTLRAMGVQSNLAQRLTDIIDLSTSSASGRLEAWKLALLAWQQHKWLGTGLLSFNLREAEQGWLYSSVIQSLHDSGIIGLLFMLWICAGCLLYTWRAFTAATDHRDKGILLGYVLAQIGLFFTSQFSSFFWGSFTWVLFGLSVGHSLVILHQQQNPIANSKKDVANFHPKNATMFDDSETKISINKQKSRP